MSTPAVLYAAKSTEDKHGSIATQLADGRKLAAERGLEVAAEYQDEAFSAFHGDRGPGLAAAMAACEQAVAQRGSCTLIVQHSDRLARGDAKQARHLIEVVLWAIKTGVELLSAQDPEMLSGGEMGLLMGVIGGMRNHQDSKRKGLAVKDGIRRRAVDRGRFVGGRRPYGYRYRDDTEDGKTTGPLVIVEAEARIVRRMFAEYIAGRAQNAIARDLQREGVPTLTPTGSWYATTVAGMLKNPLYVGMVTLDGEHFPAVGPDGKPTHEPIIDSETWDAACRLRAARNSEGRPRGRRTAGRHLLTEGLLRCTCGAAMSPVTKRDKRAANGVGYESYHCVKRLHHGPDACPQTPLSRKLVDESVYRYFERIALDQDATHRAVKEQAARDLADLDAQRHEAENELARAEAALSRIEGDYIAGRIDADKWTRLEDRLKAEMDAARAQVDQHERRKRQIEAALAAFDLGKAVADELTELRRLVAGEIQAGREGKMEALRATLKRLFVGFQLAPRGDLFVGASVDGAVWAGNENTQELLGVGEHYLRALLRSDAIDVSPDADFADGFPAVQRVPLLLHSNLCARLAAW